MTQQACQWRQTNDPYMPDTWEADCGAMWTFTGGSPKDNHMRFCPQCGRPLQQIDNAMNHKSDPYASEAESAAVIAPYTLSAAEKKLHDMMDERGAWEQGAETYPVLYQIAIELLEREAQGQQEPVAFGALARRRVFDYIRGAYDLGYNDARQARTIPGDGAPGYKGRDAEAAHGIKGDA